MEGENDDIDIWHLLSVIILTLFEATDHSSNREIWADSFLLSILLDVI